MIGKDSVPLVKVAMPPPSVLMPALESVLYSGMIGEGEHVYEFERLFGEQFGLKNALAVNSGTAALHIAFILAGVKPNDEVITTSMTAEPTNTSILQAGGIPVFADVDPVSGNLCPGSVESLITGRTKAICVVHYAGYPARLNELRAIADKHGIRLIEDCAHALGATYGSQSIGSVGDYAIFSFQAIKHMTTVDGGMLIVKESSELEKARRLRWFGLAKGVPRTEIDIEYLGYKYNMNNVTAVVGIHQLGGIGERLKKHQENGRFFDSQLDTIPGLCSAKVEHDANPSYWIYTLLSEHADDVERILQQNGITASKLHRPSHYHSIFKGREKNLQGLDCFYKRLTHIPCGWWVDAAIRQKIVDVLRQG